MGKKAKFRVHGYLPDLMSWFALPKKRRRWIENGDPNLDPRDPVKKLSERLHPGMMETKVISIKRETPTARTFTLKCADGNRLPWHYAGQYLCIYPVINGAAAPRPYAISSAPMEAYDGGYIQFTVKKKEGGYVSEYLWKEVKEGSRLKINAPFGDLYYSAIRDSKHVVGIAGGSGITMFRSMIRDMPTSGRPEKLTLLYGSRSEEDILFRNELDELAANSHGRVKVIHILSEAGDSWQGERGFISAEHIARLVEDYQSASFFVSGPTVLYGFIKGELEKLNISKTRIRMESFGETEDITTHKDFPASQVGKVYLLTVKFGVDERVIPSKSTETVVQALERAALPIDTHCRSGSCGYCRSLLESGKVWQRPEGDGVRARDKDVGYFHPCSSYPMSDLTVRVFTQI